MGNKNFINVKKLYGNCIKIVIDLFWLCRKNSYHLQWQKFLITTHKGALFYYILNHLSIISKWYDSWVCKMYEWSNSNSKLTGLGIPQALLVVHLWWIPSPNMYHNLPEFHCDICIFVGHSLQAVNTHTLLCFYFVK